MIIYNEKTIFTLIFGIAFGLAMASFSRNASLSLLVGALVVLAFDLGGRLRDGENTPAVLHPDAGAHVWFIPLWIIGLIVAGGTFLSYMERVRI